VDSPTGIDDLAGEPEPSAAELGPDLPLPEAVEEAAEEAADEGDTDGEPADAPLPADGDDAGDVFDSAADDDVSDDEEVDIPVVDAVPDAESGDDESAVGGGAGEAQPPAQAEAGSIVDRGRAWAGSAVPEQGRRRRDGADAVGEPGTRTGDGSESFAQRDVPAQNDPSAQNDSPAQTDPHARSGSPAQSDPPVVSDSPAQSGSPAQTDPHAQSGSPAQSDPPAVSDSPAQSGSFAQEGLVGQSALFARSQAGASDDAAELPALMEDAELAAALEAIMLVVDEPVAEMQLAQILEQPTERVGALLEDISARYTAAGHGFDLRRVAGGWRLYTRPEYAAYVERFVLDGQSLRLTQAALETLAVVAYKQPVTRSRISAIRGVNCDGVMRTLVTRGLIEECGTEGETGAYLYRTTALFLEKLGLNSVDQLPPLAPFLPDDVEEVLDAPG
jgi:segregation and condensation protein B